MPPRSPGANSVMKTSGSAAAAERGASIMARAARAKARAWRSVVIGKLLDVGTACDRPGKRCRCGKWSRGFLTRTAAMGGRSSLHPQLPAPLYFLDHLRHRQSGIDIGRAFADPVLDVGHVPLGIKVGRQSRIALPIEARWDAGPLVGALVETVRVVGLQRPPLRAVLLEAGVVNGPGVEQHGGAGRADEIDPGVGSDVARVEVHEPVVRLGHDAETVISR